jgi:uncharacterized membrane protein YecN with MAPEG domain
MLTVVLARRRNRQSLGDGGNPDMLQAIRRHGNFAENAALFIAGFALLELTDGNRPALEIMCAIFVLARISHAIGLSLPKTVNAFRLVGIVATIAVGMVLGVRLIRIGLPLLG